LQQFLSLAAWDDRLMADRLAQIVARDHGHPGSIGIIDETSNCDRPTRWCSTVTMSPEAICP
jgi:hypothetical protein